MKRGWVKRGDERMGEERMGEERLSAQILGFKAVVLPASRDSPRSSEARQRPEIPACYHTHRPNQYQRNPNKY
eukprot:2291050-Rhodomonas_salina.1